MTSLTETIEYTPRNDWGALPWGSVETWAWGGREVADAREVADWIVGKGPQLYSRFEVTYRNPRGDDVKILCWGRECEATLWRNEHGKTVERVVRRRSWKAARQVAIRWMTPKRRHPSLNSDRRV